MIFGEGKRVGEFGLASPYSPTGDQPDAIEALYRGGWGRGSVSRPWRALPDPARRSRSRT